MNRGSDPRIAHFVRDTLGCNCPEPVFDRIVLHVGGAGRMIASIEVGGRLLIRLVDADRGLDIAQQLGAAVQPGVVERDSRGFNRFRLVVLASAAEAWIARAEQAFRRLPRRDALTYLHILEPAAVAGFLPRWRLRRSASFPLASAGRSARCKITDQRSAQRRQTNHSLILCHSKRPNTSPPENSPSCCG